MDEIIIYTDGASRGNPGPAGIGVVLCTRKGEIIQEISEHLGTATNNIAEYTAVIRGLEAAALLKSKRVTVVSDSQLMVRQMTGEYKVKNEGLIPLHHRIRQLVGAFEGVEFVHIPRERNQRADRLSKKGSVGEPEI